MELSGTANVRDWALGDKRTLGVKRGNVFFYACLPVLPLPFSISWVGRGIANSMFKAKKKGYQVLDSQRP